MLSEEQSSRSEGRSQSKHPYSQQCPRLRARSFRISEIHAEPCRSGGYSDASTPRWRSLRDPHRSAQHDRIAEDHRLENNFSSMGAN